MCTEFFFNDIDASSIKKVQPLKSGLEPCIVKSLHSYVKRNSITTSFKKFKYNIYNMTEDESSEGTSLKLFQDSQTLSLWRFWIFLPVIQVKTWQKGADY